MENGNVDRIGNRTINYARRGRNVVKEREERKGSWVKTKTENIRETKERNKN